MVSSTRQMNYIKRNKKSDYDQHYKAIPLLALNDGTEVYIRTGGTRNTTGTLSQQPRSYEVQTNNGTTRRNRRHLTSLPNPTGQNTPSASHMPPDLI